ncbi:MAG TPA: hypothetical protein VG148_15520 [Pyrinomonadaceae bacterium]|nr:hypothetical protein [Pyrinomonadaceae bacterium]
MKAAALLILCVLCAVRPSGAPAQKGAAADGVRVRARGRSLVLSERGRSHVLRVADKIDAARIKGVTVVFVSRAGEFVYLLLDVCGLSKAEPDDRQCGAGVECNLLWLKLDGGRRVAASDSAHYESCWLPITSDEGYDVTGRTLRMRFSDLRERLEYTLTYDADRPGQGLQIEKHPAPNNQ